MYSGERHLLLAHFLKQPERDLDLAVGALLIAEEEFPGLDVSRYTERLDELARGVESQLPASGSREAPLIITALRTVLFEKEAFRGAEDDYYNPRNSYLNVVMDRKIGIPITLSLLYMEVARRVGFHLQGVGFPGHFLLKHVMDRHQIVVDPFFGGRTLDLDDLRELLRNVGGGTEIGPSHLEPISKREVLARVLRNLRANYLRIDDQPRALSAIERLLLIEPDNEQLESERRSLAGEDEENIEA